MNKKWVTPLLALAGSLAAGSAAAQASPASSPDGAVASERTRTIAGQRFRFVKHVDAAGNTREAIYDAAGRAVPESALPRRTRSPIEAPLSQALEQLEGGHALGADAARLHQQGRIAVQVALNLPAGRAVSASTGEGMVYAGQWQAGTIDGRALSATAAQASSQRVQADRARRRAEHQLQRHAAVLRWAQARGWHQQPGIAEALRSGRSSVVLSLTPAQVRQLAAGNDPMVAGIGLAEVSQDDDLNSAMAATSISTAALPNSATRGKGVGIFQTESGCPSPSKISNYSRLSGSESDHSRNVASIVRAVSPESYLYCRAPETLPYSSDLDGVDGHPAIRIITRSSSGNDTTTYNSTDRDWDNYAYDHDIAIFNSGGNTGEETGNVRSPGKALNLITVGNYDDNGMKMRASSPWRDPETGNEKPELTAPGSHINAGGVTMSGTSQATPHAAAFAADMMSDLTVLMDRPYLLKARMLAGATDVIQGNSDQLGVGGIDFQSAHYDGYWAYWAGANGDFTKYDAADGKADGFIDRKITITSEWKKVRVAIAWMNRGSYTYAHADDSHAIGMDLDLKVYDPNGNYVGGSTSYDNPFEVVSFSPTVYGTYTVRISRPHNADTQSDLRIGLYANYYK